MDIHVHVPCDVLQDMDVFLYVFSLWSLVCDSYIHTVLLWINSFVVSVFICCVILCVHIHLQ